MKRNICAILLSTVALSFGCKSNNSNLNIQVKDSETAYTYNAVYPAGKTETIKKFIALRLDNTLAVVQKVDTILSLPGGYKFKIKAIEGELNIWFDKKNNSAKGYVNIKKLTDEINKMLSEK